MKLQTLLCIGLTVALTPACDAAPEVVEQVEPPPASDENRDLPYYADPAFTPHWFASAADIQPDFHQIPAFALPNQYGEVVTEDTVAGKVYVANFFFASCAGICRKMNTNVQRVQDTFAEDEDVLFLSHSVTPDADTPEVLLRYSADFGSQRGRWHFLTGDREQIYALGRQSYFAEEDRGNPRPDAFLHSENLLLVDGNRRLRGIYNGLNSADVSRLIDDLHQLREVPLRNRD